MRGVGARGGVQAQQSAAGSAPTSGRAARAEVIWCALRFPVQGLGSGRMAL